MFSGAASVTRVRQQVELPAMAEVSEEAEVVDDEADESQPSGYAGPNGRDVPPPPRSSGSSIPVRASSGHPSVVAETERTSLMIDVREFFPGANNDQVRAAIFASFDVPQRGPYHTEGVFMAAHLALCRKTIQDIKEGVFPEEIPPDVREVLSRVVAQYGEQLKRYVFLHDIAKGECLLFKYKDGTSRELTLEEFKAEAASADIWHPFVRDVRMNNYLDSQGVESISYYHKDKKHGEAGRALLEQMGYTGVPLLILTAIAKHEVAFSFKDANAAVYADHFGALTPEERDLVLTASFIDTWASRRQNGKPDLTNFKALVDSRYNFEFLALVAAKLKAETQFKPAAIDDRLSKLTVGIKTRIQGSVDEIAARVIKELQPATFNMTRVETGLSTLVSAGAITEDQKRRILELLSAGGLPALGKEFGRFMGKIRPVLDAAKDE